MSDLKGFEKALGELSSLLEKRHVPYMIIGGLANAVWGTANRGAFRFVGQA